MNDPELRYLVDRNHGHRQRKPDPATGSGAHANCRFSPGPSTFVTHRLQISGWAGFEPTSVRRCQQRTHFTADVFFTVNDTRGGCAPCNGPCVVWTVPSGSLSTSW